MINIIFALSLIAVIRTPEFLSSGVSILWLLKSHKKFIFVTTQAQLEKVMGKNVQKYKITVAPSCFLCFLLIERCVRFHITTVPIQAVSDQDE